MMLNFPKNPILQAAGIDSINHSHTASGLALISQTHQAAPPRFLIHGAEKAGKSTLAAGAPSPIFIRTEDGLNGIRTMAFPLATTLNQVKEQLNTLITEDHEFKTVVIDSADWLEQLIHQQVCIDEGVDSIIRAGGGYGNGFRLANNHWHFILHQLDKLNKQKGMMVIIICHSRVVTVNDPLHQPYDQYILKLHKPGSGQGSCDLLAEWADVIGFCECEKFIQSTDNNKTGNRAKTSGNRFIHLENNPAYIAGNRYGLPAKLPLNWQALQQALIETMGN